MLLRVRAYLPTLCLYRTPMPYLVPDFVYAAAHYTVYAATRKRGTSLPIFAQRSRYWGGCSGSSIADVSTGHRIARA
eukprot:593429-Rhodomonas_salina.4